MALKECIGCIILLVHLQVALTVEESSKMMPATYQHI